MEQVKVVKVEQIDRMGTTKGQRVMLILEVMPDEKWGNEVEVKPGELYVMTLNPALEKEDMG